MMHHMTLYHIHCFSLEENQGGTLLFHRLDSGMRVCLWHLLEIKQGVPMMLVEVSVNLHYFGFHIKDIRINLGIFFNNCKFLHVGSDRGG
jgi:hypothetical protein